jgi:S-layer homology domain
VRVALAWSSHTAGSSNIGKSDVLRADLDLVVRQPNGSTTGSFSFDNSYEAVDLIASGTGKMRITVRHDRFDATLEPFGLAWALTSPFTDIEGSKYYGQILWVAQRSIMAGCTSTRFCPDRYLTRGQLAKALVEGLDLPSTNTDYFADDEGHRYEGAINRLRAAGLTSGCGGGNYCPDRSLRRGRLAQALDRALRLPATNTDYFRDDNGRPAEDAINRVAHAGIGSCCGDGRFCPDRRVRREHATVFLRRAFD